MSGSDSEFEVEISSGVFIPVKQSDWEWADPKGLAPKERARLKMWYKGNDVSWEGDAIPNVLREYDGRLYAIGFDRQTKKHIERKRLGESKCMLRYYRQEGEAFVEIPAREFPPSIAVQNMGIENREAREITDLRMLNTDSFPFRISVTAFAWREIETGEPMDEYGVDAAFLKQFIAKHRPIALQTMKRITATQPSTRTTVEKRD